MFVIVQLNTEGLIEFSIQLLICPSWLRFPPAVVWARDYMLVSSESGHSGHIRIGISSLTREWARLVPSVQGPSLGQVRVLKYALHFVTSNHVEYYLQWYIRMCMSTVHTGPLSVQAMLIAYTACRI